MIIVFFLLKEWVKTPYNLQRLLIRKYDVQNQPISALIFFLFKEIVWKAAVGLINISTSVTYDEGQ